jgi:putative redox protein
MPPVTAYIDFPEEKCQDTHFDNMVIHTDTASVHKYPSPGAIFIAGVGTCTASTVRGYCKSHHLPLPNKLIFTAHFNEEKEVVEKIEMEIIVPSEFPQDKLDCLIRAAGTCTVKKWWQNPPQFETTAKLETIAAI